MVSQEWFCTYVRMHVYMLISNHSRFLLMFTYMQKMYMYVVYDSQKPYAYMNAYVHIDTFVRRHHTDTHTQVHERVCRTFLMTSTFWWFLSHSHISSPHPGIVDPVWVSFDVRMVPTAMGFSCPVGWLLGCDRRVTEPDFLARLLITMLLSREKLLNNAISSCAVLEIQKIKDNWPNGSFHYLSQGGQLCLEIAAPRASWDLLTGRHIQIQVGHQGANWWMVLKRAETGICSGQSWAYSSFAMIFLMNIG